MTCKRCGKETSCLINDLCEDCRKTVREEELEERLKDISGSASFKSWSGRDLSDAFWLHLGRYTKEPNARSYGIIMAAYNWACHADHGLANSFFHALKWAKFDVFEEGEKWRI